jgi:hypothetical protein
MKSKLVLVLSNDVLVIRIDDLIRAKNVNEIYTFKLGGFPHFLGGGLGRTHLKVEYFTKNHKCGKVPA